MYIKAVVLIIIDYTPLTIDMEAHIDKQIKIFNFVSIFMSIRMCFVLFTFYVSVDMTNTDHIINIL